MKKILALVATILAIQNAVAQKVLYLKPALGAQWTLCTADKSMGDNQVFGASKGGINPSIGFLAELALNEKWALAAGWHVGSIGWGYSLEMPAHLTKNPAGIGSTGWSTTSVSMHRFPVLVKRNFTELSWGKTSADNLARQNKLTFYAQGGVSFDFLPATRFGENTNAFIGSGVADSYGDTTIYFESTGALHKFNASAIVGLGTQLYLKNQQRLDVTLFYSRGLRTMIREDVVYQLNSYHNDGRIFSRGSVIGATLAYPIRLKTCERKSV